jgi:hypothetical protein
VASLDGSEETPPTSVSGSGEGTFVINNDQTQIEFDLSQTGLENVLFAHIHVGPPGVAGPIIFNLAGGSFTEVTGTLTAADLAPAPAQGINTFADAVNSILAGNTYANIHTAQFPGGAVRGQIRKR